MDQIPILWIVYSLSSRLTNLPQSFSTQHKNTQEIPEKFETDIITDHNTTVLLIIFTNINIIICKQNLEYARAGYKEPEKVLFY